MNFDQICSPLAEVGDGWGPQELGRPAQGTTALPVARGASPLAANVGSSRLNCSNSAEDLVAPFYKYERGV